MGAPLAAHVSRGCPLVVWSRSGRGVEGLGAVERTPDAAAVARQAAVICTMLGGPDDVREVWDALIPAARPGTVLVDLTTASPTLARELAHEAEARGLQALDAPVTGGRKAAVDGALTLMVGGAGAALDDARPVLERFARTIHHLGPAGSGQAAKAVNQTAVAGIMRGLAEAIALARAQGLPRDAMLDVLRGGTARAFLLDAYGDRLWDGDPAPAFSVAHFTKDLRLAEQAAEAQGLGLDGTAGTRALYERLVDGGRGADGIQALIDAVDDRN